MRYRIWRRMGKYQRSTSIIYSNGIGGARCIVLKSINHKTQGVRCTNISIAQAAETACRIGSQEYCVFFYPDTTSWTNNLYG